MTSHQHQVGWYSIYELQRRLMESSATGLICDTLPVQRLKKIFFFVNLMLRCVETCVAEWLTPRTRDLEAWGSSLARHVDSLDKELYSTLSLLTQGQLFEGRLALNPGLNLNWFLFLLFNSIFSDNFLCYFENFQSSSCRLKEITLKCFLSFQILI